MRTACLEQGTHEWFAARLGRVSASRIADAMSYLTRASGDKKAGASSAKRDDYLLEKATELITRVPADHYVSKPMEIGTQYEGEARIEFWMRSGLEIQETGFVLHPTLDYLGASPDGLIGQDGGLELKVPLISTHMDYLLADEIPTIYRPQVFCEMLCCEREWWEFASYCPPDIYPDLPDRFRLFRKRVTRSDAVLEIGGKEYRGDDLFRKMEEEAINFMGEAVALVENLSARFPELAKPEPQTEQQAYEEAVEMMDSLEMTP
jgi:hypothetical protein